MVENLWSVGSVRSEASHGSVINKFQTLEYPQSTKQICAYASLPLLSNTILVLCVSKFLEKYFLFESDLKNGDWYLISKTDNECFWCTE